MSSRPRRSTRRGGNDEVIAPGFGTKSDIARLTADLGGTLPENAVLAMMKSEGRGIIARTESTTSGAKIQGTPTKASGTGPPFASPSTSNMWADFIQEEGVAVSSSTGTNEPPNKKSKAEPIALSKTENYTGQVEYDLSVLTKEEKAPPFGFLVQAGTLDSTLVGRKKITIADTEVYNLSVPTTLLPSVSISKVCTSCNAAHAVAIDKSNQAYGWGRNEGLQLGSSQGASKVIPTPEIIARDILSAALGKSHTIFLKTDGTLHALGQNKSGQCGWREGLKQSGVLKPCVLLASGKKGDQGLGNDSTVFCKIACGEDFSIALDSSGTIHTTGSSEFGQLANGDTGEYIVTAGKVSFANRYGFLPQTIFHENDDDVNIRSDQNRKTVPVQYAVKIQDIAAGKHHGLALEAPSSRSGTRIFTWGCGDYGVLGHNRQKDEYYPRHVAFVPRGMSFKKIGAGAHCSLALTGQGHLYYWGQHRSNSEAVMKPQLVDALANNQHIVTHFGGGTSCVACTTNLGNTIVWGQGPYGELGLGSKKSSAKPTFVDTLEGLVVSDLACGQGIILYVIKDDKKLPKADLKAVDAALNK